MTKPRPEEWWWDLSGLGIALDVGDMMREWGDIVRMGKRRRGWEQREGG